MRKQQGTKHVVVALMQEIAKDSVQEAAMMLQVRLARLDTVAGVAGSKAGLLPCNASDMDVASVVAAVGAQLADWFPPNATSGVAFATDGIVSATWPPSDPLHMRAANLFEGETLRWGSVRARSRNITRGPAGPGGYVSSPG